MSAGDKCDTEGGLYLSSSSSYHQLIAVFTQADLLDAQPGVIAVWIKTAHLHAHTHTHKLIHQTQHYDCV